MKIDWPKFIETIRGHRTFLLTSHIRPDCDALGSELGMAGVLEALGKEVLIVNGQPTPPNLAFIDPQRRIQALGHDLAADQLPQTDVLMVLDTGVWVQLGSMADVVRASKARKIVVDHHVSGDDLEALVFKDSQIEATGRLVLEAARQLDVALTPSIAVPLFAAIATDTGWFRFSSTRASTYRAAADLIDAGVRPDEIFAQLYERDTIGRLRLRGLILSRVQADREGRLMHSCVRKEDFTLTGALPSDTEDVINMILAIEGVQVAVIAIEQPQGGSKISLRSRCEVDCSRVAEHFGGGGHKAAAGAFLNELPHVAIARVLDAVRAAMR
ncbi:MAG: bifunctional oligoribonuclease/PAP phosphatase NrnA [Candidatus Anammoximicrobium sp.]|nr:bifunctional oligoribonuclease/PAP phosphatase NrnA [Candidatus Anammoximicrobium sp.]